MSIFSRPFNTSQDVAQGITPMQVADKLCGIANIYTATDGYDLRRMAFEVAQLWKSNAMPNQAARLMATIERSDVHGITLMFAGEVASVYRQDGRWYIAEGYARWHGAA